MIRISLILSLLFATTAQAQDLPEDGMVEVLVEARDLAGTAVAVPISVGDQLLGQTGEPLLLPDYTVSVTIGEGDAATTLRVAPLGAERNRYLVRVGQHADGLDVVDAACPAPRYPPAAKRKGIVGSVHVEVVFGPDGVPLTNKDPACLGYATTAPELRRRTWHLNKCVEVVAGRTELTFDVLVAAAKARIEPLAEGSGVKGIRGRSSVVFVAEPAAEPE